MYRKGVFPFSDFAFILFAGASGYTFHGVFGGDSGKFAPVDNYAQAGIYSFEGITLEEIIDGENLEIEYFGECTIFNSPSSQGPATYINCAVESKIFGKGRLFLGAGPYRVDRSGCQCRYL